MDVSNVGRTKRFIFERSICCDALLGGAMVFVSPLLNVNHSQMLALINNIEKKSLLMGHQLGIQRGHVGPPFHLTPKGHPLKYHLHLNLS
jgi:hypothetical protein